MNRVEIMNVYFLGGGNMAAAVAGGLVKQGEYRIHIANRGAEKRERLQKELGVETSATLPELHSGDVLILAVKPQDMEAACKNIRTNGVLVLSVAAGLSVGTLSRYLGGTRRIVRVMPNTPGKIGLGVSGMFAEAEVSETDRRIADRIMKSVGLTIWLEDEAQMHGITGISGSGPAYVFYLLDALQNAAIRQGFDMAEARALSLATFKGAVALAEQTGEDFEKLQKNVTSKGGTTHEAVEAFRRHRVAEAISEGVCACVRRSQEMERQYQ
ncbi:TPA: pyrroline-5-carboxylate reductase [Neisseria meningitidis]|uniref:pyrroline-5-carboxylate reductase n=1 Tax=Neisseria meningitidis TaxID=487 RepID=UPI0021489B48|nr:pyrroline-5-carboxylate reductase [Neisseria meningitidis]